MLQKPDLPDGRISSCLANHYGLDVTEVAFLPLGADPDSAIYRIIADDDTSYLLKLRQRGAFAETTVEIPQFLHEQGIAPIISPIATTTGRLWTALEGFAVILYPFIQGRNGFEAPLSDLQWFELGVALRGIHTAALPLLPSGKIPKEAYSSRWRGRVRELQARAEQTAFTDPVAAQVAELLRIRRETITDLVARADTLGAALRDRQPACVLCHADLHAGNVLIGEDGGLYIVDWDTAILAPKERDLMFIGGGVGGVWNEDREVALFYQGYGTAEMNPLALAYYRYERIVEDIAAYCDELLLSTAGGAARARALGFFRGQFEANDVVEIAVRSDPFLHTPPR